ncbi:uncharacterized protein EDB93DRAFT_1246953 [Suillus bovinus]|uniref:uncharacterized protein n=1 Tax=Suillus bovinus TaxID=48563 RepID=UPI001B8758AD|nr:uncharacterized protein EDB93DRAFT_1246953 [Suillus bovinus]KAG2156763.1 hypothetical protein EDB93DRAFT_1246953 [Suillus bovinus]
MAATGADSPLGSDKGKIYGGLTKIIFTDHPKYGATYLSNPKKFCDAIGSCINIFRNKYKKVKVMFGSTGAGVMPAEGSQAKNLMDVAILELPWYKDLDTIWHSNLSMAATTHSSKPGVDHAGALYTLQLSHPPNTQQYLHPPSAQQSHSPIPPNMHVFASSQYPPPALHQSPPASSYPSSCAMSPNIHLPGLPSDDNDANNWDLSKDNGMMLDDDAIMLDNTSPVVGKKHQLPSMPSPPPNLPEPFDMLLKKLVSAYHSCLAFRVQKALSREGHCRLPLEILCSASTPLLKMRNTTLVSDFHMSLTPETSIPHSAGSSKKKATSDVSYKHLHFLAKLKVKSEHNQDTKKYKWLHSTHEYETSQAAVTHQCMQEDKATEIRLRKMDIHIHQAHLEVLDKEAETLRLKIQFHQMVQASKVASDGGVG